MNLIIDIYNLAVTNIVFKGLIVSLMGLGILSSHAVSFRYLLSKNFIYVCLMLPTLILFVTTVIATNLYLSLGMIGALSIVRYRTPVKSQYELALYFSLICIGIISGVNFKLSLITFLFLILLPLGYFIFIKLFKIEKILNNDDTEKIYKISVKLNISNTHKFLRDNNLTNYLSRIENDKENKNTLIVFVLKDYAISMNLLNKLENDQNVTDIQFFTN